MSVGGCYTDFHIDFGGTSVWYHIMRGKKVRIFNSFTGNSPSQHCPKIIVHRLPPPPPPSAVYSCLDGLGRIFENRPRLDFRGSPVSGLCSLSREPLTKG